MRDWGFEECYCVEVFVCGVWEEGLEGCLKWGVVCEVF